MISIVAPLSLCLPFIWISFSELPVSTYRPGQNGPAKSGQNLCNTNCKLSCVCAYRGFISLCLLFNVFINCRAIPSPIPARSTFVELFAWQLLPAYHQSANGWHSLVPGLLLRFWAVIFDRIKREKLPQFLAFVVASKLLHLPGNELFMNAFLSSMDVEL